MRPPVHIGPRGIGTVTVAVRFLASGFTLPVAGDPVGPDPGPQRAAGQGFGVETDTVRVGGTLDRLRLAGSESLQAGWSGDAQTLLLALVAIVVVGLALAVAAVGWRQRRERETRPGDDSGTVDDPTEPGDRAHDGVGESDTGSAAGDTSEGESVESQTGDGAGGESRDDRVTEQGRDTPPESLSSKERVLRLLGQNGGRMRQQAVAERLDWTAAKTSQVVSDLREDGAIESFRIGRENVLTLPDVGIMDPTDDEDDPAG